MNTRILFFGDSDIMGNLYNLYLRSKGYEVLHFTSPRTCALVSNQSCTCSRKHACADIILTEMDLEGMTGLDLIRQQKERGCNAPPRNKAVLSTGLNKKQEQDFRDIGCISLKKPFRLIDLIAWVNECEKNIPPDRKLVPREELISPTEIEHGIQNCYIEERMTGN
jgi:CheY-like chemotaxis protein